MTFESFKKIHENSAPIDKINLLKEQTANALMDVMHKEDAKRRQNKEEEEYWKNESVEMGKRMDWLFDELRIVLREQ